jgi:hypothetical protein
MKTTLFGIAVACGLFAASGEARSAQMPHYDPAVSCDAVARVGIYSRMILNGCLQNEQNSYDTLSPRWSSLPADMRAECDTVARAADSAGSYQILLGCVENEIASADAVSKFQFRR